MRRAEHEQSRDFALNIIDSCTFMVLSMVGADGAPYAVPLSPVRQADCLYFHCALEGRKLTALRAHPKVSLTFVGDTRVPPGEFTLYYDSVLAEGTASEVTAAKEREAALRRLCEKYCPDDMGDFERVLRAWSPRTGIWKIKLENITGKSNFTHN